MINRIMAPVPRDHITGDNMGFGFFILGDYIYWADYVEQKIKRRKHTGLGVVNTIQSGVDTYGVRTDGTYIYYVNQTLNQLCRIPLAGGTPEILATGIVDVYGIEVTGGYVYLAFIYSNQIKRVSSSGGVPAIFITGYGTGVLHAHNQYLYWADYNGGYTYRALIADGSGVEMLCSGLNHVSCITHYADGTGDDTCYFVESGAGEIRKKVDPAVGSSSVVVEDLGVDEPIDLAFIDNKMIWSMRTSGAIMSLEIIEDNYGSPLSYIFDYPYDVAYQDDKLWITYGDLDNRLHWHQVILYKQSPNVYAVFGRQTYINAIGNAIDTLLKNMIAYCQQATHEWRTYYADGTDSVEGPFTRKLCVFDDQPPAVVNPGMPWVVGTMTITAITPTTGMTCGPVNFDDIEESENDEDDRPEEFPP